MRSASEYRGARRNARRGSGLRWRTDAKVRRSYAVASHGGTVAFWRMSADRRAAFMRGGNHPRLTNAERSNATHAAALTASKSSQYSRGRW